MTPAIEVINMLYTYHYTFNFGSIELWEEIYPTWNVVDISIGDSVYAYIQLRYDL